ncbi:hypothetical protein SKAU_G00383110 [Synaphobranchus kaupii]|uniref:alanine transaminase n=1 Tax=Synaphobranchus kaupii TaxID=118154 RepID=A0A9Q1EE96_SYNKA|nr:hypothetical protein SKAU_G00383110 [Synaphobranchus kaupii]
MVSAKSVLLCAAILSGIALVSHGASVGSYMDYCPPGWTEFNERCFKFISGSTNWADAEINCENIGGNLASVHSEEEYAFIRQLVKQHDSSEPTFWLGLSDHYKEDTWLWSDGTRVDFTLWNPGEPNNVGLTDALEGNYKMSHGASVGSYMDYCPPGWTEFNERCFKFISGSTNWADAEINCQNIGGNLASVHSEEEYAFIRQLVKQHDSSQPTFWLGLSDHYKEGTWLWSDGSRVDFTLWNPGEPNNVGLTDALLGNYQTKQSLKKEIRSVVWDRLVELGIFVLPDVQPELEQGGAASSESPLIEEKEERPQPVTLSRFESLSPALYESVVGARLKICLANLHLEQEANERQEAREAKERAQKRAYAEACGIPHVQRSVSDFISRRDGGIPSNPDNIFICNGSQSALMVILKLLSCGRGLSQTGILGPVPTNNYFNMMLATAGSVLVPYHLFEEEGWALKVEELCRVLGTSRSHGRPRALYVINPGNPTGHVQSRESIEEVIRFATEERLFLLADEVYQDNMHTEDCEFISYKKVLFEMGPKYSDTLEMASFHSISKGPMGECGLRGGYMELVNIDPAIINVIRTLLSALGCSSLIGQIALDIMADPPQEGDPSYPTYSKEIRYSRETLAWNVRLAHDVLGGLPGVRCQPVMGGTYVYPCLHLPSGAVEQAKVAGMEADQLYCSRLLKEADLCVNPGCEYGQREGTHHLRIGVLTPTENLEELLRRFKAFHLRFLAEFS